MTLFQSFFAVIVQLSAIATSLIALCLGLYLALSKNSRYTEFIASRLTAFLIVLIVAFILMRSF